MNLYLIERTDSVGWDESIGMVVRAEAGDVARALTSGNWEAGWDRNRSDPASWPITITQIATNVPGEPGLVLVSFNAG